MDGLELQFTPDQELPFGSVNKGDVLTFGDDPMKWIAEEVSLSPTGILAIGVRPEKSSGLEMTAAEFVERYVNPVFGPKNA